MFEFILMITVIFLILIFIFIDEKKIHKNKIPFSKKVNKYI